MTTDIIGSPVQGRWIIQHTRRGCPIDPTGKIDLVSWSLVLRHADTDQLRQADLVARPDTRYRQGQEIDGHFRDGERGTTFRRDWPTVGGHT